MAEEESRRPRAERLTFVYDAEGIRLERRTPRIKSAPVGAPLDRRQPDDGVLLELRARDEVLYRVVLRDPLPQSLETLDRAGRLGRAPVARSRGAFSIVVPRVEGETQAVVLAGPKASLKQRAFAAPRDSRGWRELVRVPLRGGRNGDR